MPRLNRIRFPGQLASLVDHAAPAVSARAWASRRAVAVMLDEPAVAIGRDEGPDPGRELVDDLRGPAPDALLLERLDEPLGAAVAGWLADVGGRVGEAEPAQCALEMRARVLGSPVATDGDSRGRRRVRPHRSALGRRRRSAPGRRIDRLAGRRLPRPWPTSGRRTRTPRPSRRLRCRPWFTADQVEAATARWVHWWNTARLHEASASGDIPPAEFEAAYHARQVSTEAA